MRIKKIHHLTLAVRNLDTARETFERLFGLAADGHRTLPAFGIGATTLRIGDDVLELAAPAHSDSAMARFLERRGEGIYNVALEVEDLDEAVGELTAQGVRISEPIEAEPGIRSAFVTMAATHGLSVQLVEIPQAEAANEVAPATSGTAAANAEEDGEEPHPAAAEAGEWADREADAGTPAAQAPLDLTPDEWSDTD